MRGYEVEVSDSEEQIIVTVRRAQGCLIDTVLEYSCPLRLRGGLPGDRPGFSGKGASVTHLGLGGKLVSSITANLTNANAGLTNKGFKYKAVN